MSARSTTQPRIAGRTRPEIAVHLLVPALLATAVAARAAQQRPDDAAALRALESDWTESGVLPRFDLPPEVKARGLELREAVVRIRSTESGRFPAELMARLSQFYRSGAGDNLEATRQWCRMLVLDLYREMFLLDDPAPGGGDLLRRRLDPPVAARFRSQLVEFLVSAFDDEQGLPLVYQRRRLYRLSSEFPPLDDPIQMEKLRGALDRYAEQEGEAPDEYLAIERAIRRVEARRGARDREESVTD